MFWNRKHAQEQLRVARPSFRPQLECLEARTLLDASGALAILAKDVNQAVTDTDHLQGAAVQQDASQIGQVVSNITYQIRTSHVPDLVTDITNFYDGVKLAIAGAAIFEAGAATSEVPVIGVPLMAGGVAIAGYGGSMAGAALEKGIEDFFDTLAEIFNGNSGGQSQQPPSPPAPPPSPSPLPQDYSGTISGSFTSDGSDDGRGFFSSYLNGRVQVAATPSTNGGYDVSGSIQLTQQTPDPAGIDDFSGTYSFGFHVASLSGSMSFNAQNSNGEYLTCDASFLSDGGIGGSWTLAESYQDNSDAGSGTFTLH